MILPKGRPIFEEIPSSCVHLGNLLEAFKEGKFSGFIELKENDCLGIILFQQGRIIDLSFSTNNNDKSSELNGSDALPFIFNLSKSLYARIALHLFRPEIIEAFAGTAVKGRISQNLSTDFVDIHRVFAHLGRRKFSGHMDMNFSDRKLIAYVFFQNGNPIDCFFFSKKSRYTHSGLKILRHVIQHADKVGASINIYRRIKTPKPVEVSSVVSPPREKIIDFLQFSFQTIYTNIRKQIGAKRFEELFADACIALTDQYPFMHPFAELVSYANGFLKIDPETDLTEVIAAINECLVIIFKAIPTGPDDILTIIRNEIRQGWESQFQDLSSWQVNSTLPILFESN